MRKYPNWKAGVLPLPTQSIILWPSSSLAEAMPHAYHGWSYSYKPAECGCSGTRTELGKGATNSLSWDLLWDVPATQDGCKNIRGRDLSRPGIGTSLLYFSLPKSVITELQSTLCTVRSKRLTWAWPLTGTVRTLPLINLARLLMIHLLIVSP